MKTNSSITRDHAVASTSTKFRRWGVLLVCFAAVVALLLITNNPGLDSPIVSAQRLGRPSGPEKTDPLLVDQVVNQQDGSVVVPVGKIDALIANQAQGKSLREIVRVFSGGVQIDNPALGAGLIPKSAVFTAESRSLVLTGDLGGSEVLVDVRFVESDDDSLVVVRDVYLDGVAADISFGRGLPFQIDQKSSAEAGSPDIGSKNGVMNAAVATPQPTMSSILGVSNSDAGITNGKVDMDCGKSWNGYYAINDQLGKYKLTLRGNNFGSTRGTVTLAGRNVTISSWSNTSIVIDPTLPWNSGPVCTIMKIRTANGATLDYGMNIVPAVRTRIYGQCTYEVARTRLEMGMSPSPTAYSNYATITGSYVPKAGDQYQWNTSVGKHTAIVTAVSAPVSSTGGIKKWTITVRERNADCRNGVRTYSTTFQTKTTGSSTTVQSYPKSSSGANTTLFWAAWR
jgi:hypothetical protein